MTDITAMVIAAIFQVFTLSTSPKHFYVEYNMKHLRIPSPKKSVNLPHCSLSHSVINYGSIRQRKRSRKP